MNPLAVITGASSGIGYELARVFAKNGYDLMIVSQSDKLAKAQTYLLKQILLTLMDTERSV